MEIWKDIKWYEWKYQVSNYGRVKSFTNNRHWVLDNKWKILKPWKRRWWYSAVNLWKLNEYKSYLTHRLVWQSFLWLDINNSKIFVCHKNELLIDGELDNSVNNLFLWTHQDNMNDMVKKGRAQKRMAWIRGGSHPRSKSIKQYTKKWEFIKEWESMNLAAEGLSLCQWSLSKVCNWIWKTVWGFIWKFNK